MNKKLSRIPGVSIFLLRVVSQTALMFGVFSFHAGAQELWDGETSVSQPTTTTAFANLSKSPLSRLRVDDERGPEPAPLVDAPSAVFLHTAASVDSSGSEAAAAGVVRPPPAKLSREEKILSEAERNTACEEGRLHGKPCRVSWSRVLGESFIFLSAQHGGNIAMDSDTRNQLTHGDFWAKYAYCVEHYRWWRWKDDDPFGVDYIGHPMMGAVTSSIYEQNDPKQRALMYENSRRYWMGRLRAMAYSAAYSAQWKIGPASEASVGNTGIFYYIRQPDHVWTNETGMQDFFITPIGGLAWNVGEDAIDRFILSRVRRGTRNKWLLLASALSTPGKSAANVARFRAPYYRDPDVGTLGADQVAH
jgi:hypothetical protein